MKPSTKCKHILELSTEEKQHFLDSFDIALSDCDGTVWDITGPIPNNAEGINLLKAAGKQFIFTSNNGMRTYQEYLSKIHKIGVKSTTENDILLPVQVIAHYMKKHHPDEICYCMGSYIFCNALEKCGVKVKDITPPVRIKLEEFHKIIRPVNEVKLVIADIHLDMNFAEFVMMYEYLIKKDCKVFINSTDARAPFAPDLISMGPGILIDAVVASANKQPTVYGKPSHLMGVYIMEQYNITESKRALFVGDNLNVDTKFGIQHKMQTLFVLSGAHTKKEMLELSEEEQPDYYANNLGDFVEFFEGLA